MQADERREVERAIASITGQELPPELTREAFETAKFAQGILAGTFLKAVTDPASMPLKVKSVDVPADADGDYEDYFIITTVSGTRIRVTVTPET